MSTEYRIIENCDRDVFLAHVNACTKEGWEPAGGVAMAFVDNGDVRRYAQALVRRLPPFCALTACPP